MGVYVVGVNVKGECRNSKKHGISYLCMCTYAKLSYVMRTMWKQTSLRE